jgi:cytoskeleton protein RodZ
MADQPVDRPAEGEGDPEEASGSAAGDYVGADATNEAEVPAAEIDHTLPGKTAPSAGTLLREAREARGIALEDLARTLNLQPRIVSALERDEHEALPAPAFVRGYIRSYARLVGMAPESLLADHDARTGGVVMNVRPSPRIEAARESVGIVHKRPGTVMAVATVGFVAVVAGLLLLAAPDSFRVQDALAVVRDADRDESRAATGPAPAPGAPTEPPAASEPAFEARVARGEARPLSPPEIVPTLENAALLAPADDEDAPRTRGAAALAGPAAAAEDALPVDENGDGVLLTRTADGSGVRVYAGGEDHLHFEFTEECWVEVRDADDAGVFRDLARDGDTVDLWGRAPFRIRLGYAPAVELTYNGSPVALRPFTRNDVASLTLGR